MLKAVIFLMILILPLSSNLFAQKQGKKYFITGQVTDINDKPVAGAIVLVDNINTDIVTNAEGMFKIKVKANATTIAVFSSAEGQSEEKINGRTMIIFKLAGQTTHQPTDKQENPDNDQINVGYGYVSKKDLTTPISKIDGQNKKYSSYSNIYEMLKGQPSVMVEGTRIFIRGINSRNYTDPLFIVDGMVVASISDISPKMVKSIEIIKGADASIYGARAASGVILITLNGTGSN
jgi:TonB-dependent SusC/RagA subfamily outer membrane receptor